MKIAISATGTHLETLIDPRFGRCPYFIIVETEDLSFEAIKNPNVMLGGGAGIQSAQLIAERGASNVLTGNCGPNAHQVLSAAGIGVIIGCSGPVRDTIDQFIAGRLSSAAEANVANHFGTGGTSPVLANPANETNPAPVAGMGRGGGRGMGRGQGRGQGQGGGRGMGMGPGRDAFIDTRTAQASNLDPNSELNMLKQQAESIGHQTQQIQQQIHELSKEKKIVAEINYELCTVCGACVDACPLKAIWMKDNKVCIYVDECVGCGMCVSECPVGAISLA
jgi:predicted Fe-Mo cluster-binding NifX family protein/ferredoxin